MLLARLAVVLGMWAVAVFCGWRLQVNPGNGAWFAPIIISTIAGIVHGVATMIRYWESAS